MNILKNRPSLLEKTNSHIWTDPSYKDSFNVVIEDWNNEIGILDLAEVFIKPDSKWFGMLFALRDKIVSLFHLKTLGDIKEGDNGNVDKWAIGARTGIFRIYGKSEHEMIFGEDDKHLDFRVSLLYEQCEEKKKKITVTTAVKFNNTLGKVYFFFIKPFHKLIVPILFKRKFKLFEAELKR
jgi:hypothetical protein